MSFLIAVMSFANFLFYPLVIGTLVAVVIEQILRQIGNKFDPVANSKVEYAMRVRKYLYRQAWTFNLIYFGAYFLLLFVIKPGQGSMPDMIWDGR